MLKVPYDQIVSTIATEKSLSEDEVKRKIEEKYNQLSGLVSKDGAAHIVANELGVQILAQQTNGALKINIIKPGDRNLEVLGRVTRVFDLKTFSRADGSQGQLASFVLGDDTGTIRVVGWGKHAETVSGLHEGTPVKLQSCYTRENLRGQPEIHLNDKSVITLNPSEDVPEATATSFSARAAAQRKDVRDVVGDDDNVELLGTMVQLFDPTFYEVCPDCNRRARQNEEGKYICQTHGSVDPTFSCVFNLYLDDGTGNIRCVFFKNQFERLINRTMEDILQLRNDPAKSEELKTILLGNTVKVIGKGQHNTMFDRVEFIVQQVYPEPDLQAEIARLEQVLGPTP